MKKFLSILTLIVMVIGVVGVLNVNAATLTVLSDTMTRQKTSTAGNHTIVFTTPSGIDSGDTVTLTFGADFNISSVVLADVTIGGNAPGTVSVVGQVITITADADTTVATNGIATIVIGNDHITNPSTVGSYLLTIGGTFGDTGYIGIGIVDNDQVTIDADYAATLTWDIDIFANGGCNTTVDDAQPYNIDFGTLLPATLTTDTDSICINDMATTATSGITVYVQSDKDALESISTPADKISNVDNGNTLYTLTTADAGYGICTAAKGSTGGTISVETEYNGTGNDLCTTAEYGVGAFNAADTDDKLFSTTAPLSAGYAELLVKAVAISTTAAHDDYRDTLTFKAIGSF